MVQKRLKRLALVSLALLPPSQLAYGQGPHPVVPPGSEGPGQTRPYVWFAKAARPALAHGPGQSTCNTSNPCYYNPGDLWTAYGLSSYQSAGNYGQGITIGIVDAYYNSQTLSDLQNFSSNYSLPLGATSSISCGSTPTVKIVGQNGGSPPSQQLTGWAIETDLDMQWAHAIAPCANLLLVVANSASYSNLFNALKYAAAHADVVSNSYGSGEFHSQNTYDTYLAGSTVPVLVSSGDSGDQAGGDVQYPCTSPYAICIGGTNLATDSLSVRTLESAWNEPSPNGSGGGCSGIESAPSFASNFSKLDCGTKRGVPDVAALADPYSGVMLYLGSNAASQVQGATPNTESCCWGGTSLASPIVAGMIAVMDRALVAAGYSKMNSSLNKNLYGAAGYTPSGTTDTNPPPYGANYQSYFYDVTTGNTAFPSTMYWDRTTGLGVPITNALGNYLVTVVK